MTDKFKPGDAVTTPDMTAYGIADNEVGWVVRINHGAMNLYDVTFSLHPRHPEGRYWQVSEQALELLETPDD